MKIWLPANPSRRALLVALVCSVLLHVLVAVSVYMAGAYGPKIVAKRGEPLFVDIAPDRPEERAPRGNPRAPPFRASGSADGGREAQGRRGSQERPAQGAGAATTGGEGLPARRR